MVTFTAMDDGDPTATADTTITIIVNEVNLAPVLTVISNASTRPGEEVTFTATATDEDIPDNTLTFSLENAEPDMAIDPLTGAFSWTPPAGTSGDFVVTVVVTDDGVPVLSDNAEVTIAVSMNEPPTFNTGDPNFPADGTAIDELTALEFAVTATDPEGGVVTYGIDAASEDAGYDAGCSHGRL